MNLVCSWGGVGTTALLTFLNSLDGYCCNSPHGYINPLKHPVSPPAHATRAVFLYGCPYTSLVSLFRRGYDRLHYVNVNSLFPPDVPYPTGNLWELTCQEFDLTEIRSGVWVDPQGEYADRCGALDWLQARKSERLRAETLVRDLSTNAYSDLADFAERGRDLFRRVEQFDNWSRGAHYPVLMVKYESLWESLDSVLEFLQVPTRERANFPPPRPRQTCLSNLGTEVVKNLESLYGDLAQRVSRLPALFCPLYGADNSSQIPSPFGKLRRNPDDSHVR